MAGTSQDAVAEALWTKVLEDFSSDRAHEAFLNHCRDADALPEAARRYREHKNTLNEDQEEEREAIDKRLAAVAFLAMAQLDMRRSAPPVRGKRILTIIAALIALTFVLGAAMLVAM